MQKLKYLSESGLNKILGAGLVLGGLTATNKNLNPEGHKAFDGLVDSTKKFAGEIGDTTKRLAHNAIQNTSIGKSVAKGLKDITTGNINDHDLSDKASHAAKALESLTDA